MEDSVNPFFGTRSDPIIIWDDSYLDYYPSEGSQSNPITVEEYKTPDYPPFSKNRRYDDVSSGGSSYKIGAPNFSNWTINTPPNQANSGPSNRRNSPQPNHSGTSMRKTTRISVRPPSKSFRMPPQNERDQIYQNIENQQNMESPIDPPYNFMPPPTYVQQVNPHYYYDTMNSIVDPPPQYGYSSYYPQSMHEHMDRMKQENFDLKDDNEGLKNQNRRAASKMKDIGGYVKHWGERLHEYADNME